MCGYKTLIVSRKQPFQQYTTQGKLLDRSGYPSFAVSRNLKDAKSHFIETKIYQYQNQLYHTKLCFNINIAMFNT